ncbi:hypothetical protein CJ195_11365 [Bacillus sp. UMB0899]|uniref:type II secretion system protein n=1 Tax=Metabacillus schmidteae TaxID=2730405 RepID=UPI000C7FE834|nr:prepilin-type N-terminal cleavage/methylation domain-containing protein [Metabacillus schmidteae]PMC37353.1 hypothetical protein CJ195_11365 [Bacillus sp. UMB0899]
MWVKDRLLNGRGLTLIEVMTVVVILGIVAAIAVPGVLGYINSTKADVCDVNRNQLERDYEVHLMIESKEHSDVAFSGYFLRYEAKVCPEFGVINYVDGEVHCSVHDHIESDEEEDKGVGVPFL